MTYYIEKQSCLLCDQLFFATEHAKQSALDLGYFLPEKKNNSTVLLYPFETAPVVSRNIKTKKKFSEVCFLGRIETRKGIEVFLKSIILIKDFLIKNEIDITLLGVNGFINSAEAETYLDEWSKLHKLKIKRLNNYDKDQAFRYLKDSNALVVLASIDETMGYTLIECLINSVPFICSDIMAFTEVINYLKPVNYSTFKSKDHFDLARKLKKLLLIKPAIPAITLKLSSHEKLWLKTLSALTPHKTPAPGKKIQISVCIPYSDRPEFLSQLLNSLHPLDGFIKEILIYVNTSKTSDSKKLLVDLKKQKKIKIFDVKNNVSPGKARNYLTHQAVSDLLLFVDDDNVVDFNVLEKILNSGSYTNWDVLCSPLKKFNNAKIKFNKKKRTTPIEQFWSIENAVETHWLPISGDFTLNIYENRIGDCNFLIKKESLIKSGGFNETLFYGEDQELLIRLIAKGFRYYLCPESFVQYRLHQFNLTKSANHEVESGKVAKIIMDNLGMGSFYILFQMFRAWTFEKNRNPHHWQMEHIKRVAGEKKYLPFADKKAAVEFESIIKNKLTFLEHHNFLECEFTKPKEIPVIKSAYNEQLELVLYAQNDIEFILNETSLKLEKGYSNILVPFHTAIGINFMSSSAEFIYIIHASRMTI
ncbi:MAG: glycosyltransferase [Rhizobacter sp.]|nr:glycosyltransferase [Bacteriovorax sp.]